MARKNLLTGFKRPRGLEFEQEVSDKYYGKFTALPFETGFGTTIGNCLRRVLLSSIQGFAITAVKITSYDADDVPHSISSEFESIPHVTEDTLEILNNLKQIRLNLLDEVTSSTQLFTFKGGGEITAAAFSRSSVIEVLNPDLHIMTMMQESSVDFEVQIDLGRGYVPAEVNDQYVEIVGTIPLDAIYTPVVKVNYDIEPCRVGQRNDYDKLVLQVWTDGTVRPEDALAEAAKIAKEHFSTFLNFNENDLIGDDDRDENDEAIKDLLATPITELELSVRARNCLDNAGVKTIGELTQKTEAEISNTRNVGKKSLLEIQEKLLELNLHLGMTDYSHLKNSVKLSRQKEEIDEA